MLGSEAADGQVYYFNFSTGESIWDHPSDKFYLDLFEREKKKLTERRQKEQETKQAQQPVGQDPASVQPRRISVAGAGNFTGPSVVISDGLTLLPLPTNFKLSDVSDSMIEMTPIATPARLLKDALTTDAIKITPLACPSNTLHPASASAANAGALVRNPSVYNAQGAGPVKSPTTALLKLKEGKSGSASSINSLDDKEHRQSAATRLAELKQSTMQGQTVSAFAVDLEREVIEKAHQDRLEALRSRLQEREQEEIKSHTDKLEAMSKRLQLEREASEKQEQSALELAIQQHKYKLEKELLQMKYDEERRLNEEFEDYRKRLGSEFRSREDQERQRLTAEAEQKAQRLVQELEIKYLSPINENQYRDMAEKKRRTYEMEADREIEKLKAENLAKKQDLVRSLNESEELERRKHESRLNDLRIEWKRREEEEENKFHAELEQTKAAWMEKIKKGEKELEAQERRLRSQLSEAHQRQLQDRELDFKRHYEMLEEEWREKISRLKGQMEMEQNALEEKLILLRQHNLRDSETMMAASLALRKAELDKIAKENEIQMSQQKKRREALEAESHLMQERDAELKHLLEKLMVEEQELSKKQIHLNEFREQQFKAILESQKESAQLVPPKQHQNVEQQPSQSQQSSDRRKRKEKREESLHVEAIAMDNEELISLAESTEDDESRESVPQHESMAGGIEDARLSKEFHRQFKREEDMIIRTKEYLRAQKTDLNARQVQLEQARLKWKQEMEDIARKFQAPLVQSVDQPDTRQSDPQPRQLENSSMVAELQTDLNQILNNLRRSEQPGVQVQQQPLYSALNPSGSQSFTKTISKRTPEVVVLRTDSAKSATKSARIDTKRWEENRQKNQELMRRHADWLSQFRQRAGINSTQRSRK